LKIIETNFAFKSLAPLGQVTDIVIHHVAGQSTAAAIHQQHLGQGWAGIGYHFFVDDAGQIFRGRPLNALGAHVLSQNAGKIGVCLNGNLEVRRPTDAQIGSLIWLLGVLRQWHPKAKVRGHKEFMATNCPGKFVSIQEILKMMEGEELRYNRVDEIPAGDLRNTIQKLIGMGILRGNEKGDLDLSMDMIRILVINDRAGTYDGAAKAVG